MRAAGRLERTAEGELRTRQGFDGPGEREFPTFRTLEVEQVTAADSRGQRGGGIAPESSFKIAIRHARNGGAGGMKEQTIVSNPMDKKNS
jgi:hypothetical protein